jgi:hypothetical protein
VLGGLLAEAVAQAIASTSVAAEPVRISCLPVAGSMPPKIRTWYWFPRWRIPVRSAAARFLEAMSGTETTQNGPVHGTAIE